MDEGHVDAIVVGSGFGGSVMAYRLQEAGLEVCLLERGKAYPPGSFPHSPHGLLTNVWAPDEGKYGLYDYWMFKTFDVLVASGLGGGSLIYANVLMRKDERWFVQDDLGGGGHEYWPVTRLALDPHYDRVEQMLRPQQYPVAFAPYRDTPKTNAFWAAAKQLGLQPFLPNLAITFANDGEAPVPGEPIREELPNLHGRTRLTCRLCGECDIGCNYGSKNTLDYTYLSAAKRLGADLRTGCEVVAMEPRPEGGYRVHYLEHAIAADPNGGEPTTRTLTADRLILAAGALGSTRLLLKNRSAFPRLSPRLGTRFSGNGDLLTLAVRATEEVDGRRVPRVIDPSYGPVITSAARVGDRLDGAAGPGFYLEDAGYPQHFAWMLHVIGAMGGGIRGIFSRRFWRGWFTDNPETEHGGDVARVLGGTDLSAGILPMLAMGRDVPDGVMHLHQGKLAIDWPKRWSNEYFARARETSREMALALGARFVDNPRWFLGRVITVHPLGGCPMGRHEAEGVVDPYGEVFGYPGLYVADGSVMPGPVGTNPSLTIAALADRFADRLLERRQGMNE
jgi:cholesterol oxidase